jgi:hypothetical protein
MIHKAKLEDITSYRDNTSHVSQSMLKRMLGGMDAFNHQKEESYYEEKLHFTVGSGVDIMLTMGRETFDELYYKTEIPKSSGKTQSIVMYVFDHVDWTQNWETVSLNNHHELILEGAQREGFYPSWGDSAKINKIVNDGEAYFVDLYNARGKQVLSADEMELVEQISESLKTSPYTAPYFDPAKHNGNVDIYYQVPIYFEYGGLRMKSLIDVLAVDHEHKLIRPMDIKTTGDYTIWFDKSARRFRYDIQAATYSVGLEHAIKNQTLPFECPDYEILNFTFIVESTVVQGNPLLYKCDSEFYQMGLYGRAGGYTYLNQHEGTKKMYYERVLGLNDLVTLYKWHMDNGFERDKDVVQSNGWFMLGWGRRHL